MLIWLGVGLYLMSAVVIDIRVSKSYSIFGFFFSPLLTLGFLNIPPYRESTSFSSVSCNSQDYCSVVGVVLMYGGEEVFYNLIIKFQSFSGPISLGCNLHKYVLAFLPSLVR